MRKLLIVMMAVFPIGACQQPSPPKLAWYKAGATTADFETARYSCMKEGAAMFPATAGVEGIADADGADMRSYDINARNRNDAVAACLRIKGWQLLPQGTRQVAAVDQRPTVTEANTVLTCKANAFKASPQAAPRTIDGGVLRFQIGQKAIAVTTAEGATTTYGVEGTHDGFIVARARDPNGSQYVVHISATERMFAMLHIVGGQPMEGLSGPCR